MRIEPYEKCDPIYNPLTLRKNKESVFRMFRNYSCKLHATVAFFNRLKSYFFQGVVTAATRGPLESTTKIVPGAVTFQNTEAMTKVKFFNYQDLLFLHERLKYLF